MGLPVVTVAAGGLPITESLVGGTPVTESTNGYGVAVTKVAALGLPVVFETIGIGGGAGTDPNFSSVVFLWEAEGTNGQTAGLVDVTGKAITTSGTGAISTAQKRIGTSSYSVGTGGWNTPDSPDWDLSATNTTPFTIEFSAYQTLLQTWEVMQHWDVTKSWWIRIAGPEIRLLASNDGTSTFSLDVTTSGFGFTAATWHDVCIEKDATGKIRFYRGGVMKYSVTPANSVFFAAAGLMGGGSDGNPNGYIDHVRITKGVARYASDSGYTFNATAFPTSSGGGGPPLDTFTTGLTGAWSTHRKLLTSYAGAFNNNTGGLIDTIYDQSGGGRNFTSSLRPALSTLGSLTSATFNSSGWPHMVGSGLANFITASAGFVVWVGSIDALPASFARLIHNAINETMSIYVFSTGNAGVYNDDGTNDQVQAAMGGIGKHVVTWRHDTGTLYVSADGGTEVSVASGNTSALTGNFELSNSATPNNAFDGKFVELYVWNVVPSAPNRASIIAQAKTLLGI
jgi:hypothetical protein